MLDPGEGDDVAGRCLLDLDAVEPEEAENLHDPLLPCRALAVDHGDRHVAADGAARDPADADRADVARVVELRHLQLQGPLPVYLRRRAVTDDRLEERRHVPAAVRGVVRGESLQGRGVDHGEVELRLRRTEPVEQVEGLVEHPVRPRLGAVDLVDHHDRAQAVRERLLRDEPRLRHRAIHRIHEQQHRIDHRQHALDFAAEVRVSRRVDDVDPELAPADRGVLGQDRDAALALERVRVHHAIGKRLARIERAGLPQQLVDQRRLAVIDVRDDGDVAQLTRRIEAHGTAGRKKGGGVYAADPETTRPRAGASPSQPWRRRSGSSGYTNDERHIERSVPALTVTRPIRARPAQIQPVVRWHRRSYSSVGGRLQAQQSDRACRERNQLVGALGEHETPRRVWFASSAIAANRSRWTVRS